MRIRTPYRVTAVAMGIVLAGVALTAPATAGARAEQDPLQALVDAVEKTGVVAVVAESTDPRGHRFATAGEAETGTGAAARPQDAFRVGSVTKTFIATVVLQLVGEHRLSLDDAVEHWLPGVVSTNGNDGRRITVRELLQHTSGIYNYTDDFPEFASTAGFQEQRLTSWTPAQIVAIAMRHEPDFVPGAGWEYSNTNYILAGMIIDKVTGHSWRYEVDRRIIEPLDLRHTVMPGTYPDIAGPHLHGYSDFGSGPVIDTTLFDPSAGGSAGEITSTTSDLTTFYQALIRGRLLRHDQLVAMEATVPAPELYVEFPGARYGLGLLWIPLSCGGGYYGHAGDLPGYSTRDGVTPDGRRAVVAERTGDGDFPAPGSEQAMQALVDQELCAG